MLYWVDNSFISSFLYMLPPPLNCTVFRLAWSCHGSASRDPFFIVVLPHTTTCIIVEVLVQVVYILHIIYLRCSFISHLFSIFSLIWAALWLMSMGGFCGPTFLTFVVHICSTYIHKHMYLLCRVLSHVSRRVLDPLYRIHLGRLSTKAVRRVFQTLLLACELHICSWWICCCVLHCSTAQVNVRAFLTCFMHISQSHIHMS